MGARPEHKPETAENIAWLAREPAPDITTPETTDPGLPPHEPPPEFPAGTGWRRILGSGRRWIAAALILAVVIGILVWANRPTPAPGPATAAASAAELPVISVSVPGLQDVSFRVNFTGTISARRDMPIGVEGEGGRIVSVLVEEGDRVKAGQVLAKLDPAVIQPQVNRLAAGLEEARADAALKQAEYERARAVEGSGALSAEETERRRAAAVTAAAQVKVAQAALAEAQARLYRTNVRAPSDGVILTRTAEVGQTATLGGEPLFRMGEGGEVEMRGQVAEQHLPQLKVGQSAQVRITGLDEPFDGRVSLLGAVIDPQSRLGTIRIALEPHPALRPGAFARADVSVGRAKRPVLPQTAVLSDLKGTYVLVVNSDNRVERRDVRIADTLAQGIVIASGLNGDERVVTTAGGFLRAGERVRVADQRGGRSS